MRTVRRAPGFVQRRPAAGPVSQHEPGLSSRRLRARSWLSSRSRVGTVRRAPRRSTSQSASIAALTGSATRPAPLTSALSCISAGSLRVRCRPTSAPRREVIPMRHSTSGCSCTRPAISTVLRRPGGDVSSTVTRRPPPTSGICCSGAVIWREREQPTSRRRGGAMPGALASRPRSTALGLARGRTARPSIALSSLQLALASSGRTRRRFPPRRALSAQPRFIGRGDRNARAATAAPRLDRAGGGRGQRPGARRPGR